MQTPRFFGQLPTPENESAWFDVIGKFKAKAAEFRDAYNALVSRQSEIPPEMREEFSDLMRRGQSIKSTVEKITSSVDTAWNWLKSKVGLSGYSDFRRYSQMAGLGVLPLIPIATVAGALALMTKFITDAIQFNQRLDEVKRLESRGYSSEQAAQIVKETTRSPGLFAGINIVPLIALGGAVAWALFNRQKRG